MSATAANLTTAEYDERKKLLDYIPTLSKPELEEIYNKLMINTSVEEIIKYLKEFSLGDFTNVRSVFSA